MLISAPCSPCPTIQRAIYGFLPLWGVKGAKNRESERKKRAFLSTFSYQRASPVWPDFLYLQAGKNCAFSAVISPHSAMLSLGSRPVRLPCEHPRQRSGLLRCSQRAGRWQNAVVKERLTKSIPYGVSFAKCRRPQSLGRLVQRRPRSPRLRCRLLKWSRAAIKTSPYLPIPLSPYPLISLSPCLVSPI